METQNEHKNKHRTMNFEQYAADGNRFINEVALELGAGPLSMDAKKKK